MTAIGTALPQAEHERMTDAQLRGYEFETNSPEQAEGWTPRKPGSDRFERIIQTYNVPHQKYSRDQMVWCCYCQERTHFQGGVAEFESGARRTVGWKCGAGHLDVELKNARAELTRQRVRKAYLLQSDQLRTLLPDLLAEVEGALQSSALRAFGECRQRFRSALQPLYMKLSAAAFHDRGVLEWDEELIDYSRVETTRETDDGDETNEHREVERLTGQKRTFEKRRSQMAGWLFVHPNSEPARLLHDIREDLFDLIEFYSITATDFIDEGRFRRNKTLLEKTVDGLGEVERTLASLPAFFGRENRKLVVWHRNSTMAGRNVYRVIANGFGWTSPDGEQVTVLKPEGYRPFKFKSMPAVKGAISRT